jgi:4-hydroxy-3-polyprenylbenzoate decarboxylase
LIWEGPFGDPPDIIRTRLVSAVSYYCHNTQNKPWYPATIVGIPPQEDAWLGKATERIFLAPIKMTMVPEIVDMDMPVEGYFTISLLQRFRKIMQAGPKSNECNVGAGQMMFNKILVITAPGTVQPFRISEYGNTETFLKT